MIKIFKFYVWCVKEFVRAWKAERARIVENYQRERFFYDNRN